MRVKVNLYFPFRRELPPGDIVLELPEGANAGDAVAALVDRFPLLRDKLYDSRGSLKRLVSALVNGTSVQFLQGFSTPLSDGDELTLLPPVGGG
ncbi:MoaD/ThiS family protein [Candidatus Bipolaricaulota bacterium]|nr:MoaD/ThiS family protein [Candidatus Bipolaricaulota bacterium]